MPVLTNIILAAITSSITLTNTSSYDASLLANDEEITNSNITLEQEQATIKIIEEVQSENSVLLSNEEIIDLSLERIQNEVYNGELTDEQMNQIRTSSIDQLLILRQSDFLIGNVTNDLILIQYG